MTVLSLFVLLLFSTRAFAQFDYCTVRCEDDDATHVACNQQQCTFASSCDGKNPAYHDLNADERQFMLDLHNERRNDVASGQLSGFDTASKMFFVTWDNELALIATYNLQKCTSYDDPCRGSSKYTRAGENVGTRMTFPNRLTPTEVIQQIYESWFSENTRATMAQINSFPNPQPTGDQEIGHFTQIVRDEAVQIGCAMVSYVNNGQENTWDLTCLYSQENTNNAPVYTTGVPCSGCPNGCDSVYTSLCASTIASDPVTGICEAGTSTGTGSGTGGNTGGGTGTPISSGGNITSPDYSNMLNAMLQNFQNSYSQPMQVERTECKRKPCEKKKRSKKHHRKSHKPEISSVIIYESKRLNNNSKIGRTVV